MTLTKPDRGWAWVVMFAACVAQGLQSGICYTVGIIQVALQKRFNSSVAFTSWANGIFIFFISSAGVIGSVIISRYNCRTALLVGSAMMTSGLAASAVVESIELIFVTYGVITGVGAGIVYTATVVVVGLNFEEKRSMATGVAASGAGVGIFIFPPLFQLARSNYGDKGFFLIMACVALNISVFGCLCFPTTLEKNNQTCALNSSSKYLSRSKRICNRFHLFRHVPFLCICLSLLASHLGINLIYVHLTNYSISRGSTDIQASLLTSVIGFTGSLGRLCIGFTGNVDNIYNMVLYFGTFGMLGTATVLFQLYSATYTGQMIYAVLFGTYSGCCYVLLNSITPELVGVNNLALAIGIEMLFAGIGSLIGALMAGVIVDNGGTYESAFTLAGFSVLMAAVFVLSAEAFRYNSQPEKKHNSPEEEAFNIDDTKCNTERNVSILSVIHTQPPLKP
ncbi:monocarboxylate transporter 12-B-like [Mizuhopecten yessoensis]|uniref:monocarboxylate transporter 12-B-like n=1 Tax=Mizuhopecten yessoensis TaxID=6573 RepID=UPI000B45D0D2|nr:monocarboxylate transporter 12-B-like [Mizuhopecten yessoensis]